MAEREPPRTAPSAQATGADGRFRFRGLRAVAWDISARTATLADDHQVVEVANGSRNDIILRPRWIVKGRLLGVPADCMAGVVFAKPLPAPVGEPPRPFGRQLWDLPDYERRPPDGWYTTSATPGVWRALVSMGKHNADGSGSTLIWDLGQVTLRLGQPAPSFTVPSQRGAVRVCVPGVPPKADDGSCVVVGLGDRATGGEVGDCGLGDDGVAFWPCVPPGEYLLTLQVSGRATHRTAFTLAAGQTAELGASLCEGVTVSFRVEGAADLIEVCMDNEQTYSQALAFDGAAQIEGVPPGQYEVWHSDGHTYKHQQVIVGTESVSVTLPALGR